RTSSAACTSASGRIPTCRRGSASSTWSTIAAPIPARAGSNGPIAWRSCSIARPSCGRPRQVRCVIRQSVRRGSVSCVQAGSASSSTSFTTSCQARPSHRSMPTRAPSITRWSRAAKGCAPRRDAAGTDEGGLCVERELLENRFFRLRLDERAQIVSLYDKRAGREVIAPGERGNRLIAFEDRPLNFDAWDINIYYGDKPYPVDDVASWRVVEEGPLRGGVEVVRRYGASTITQRILVHANMPRIDFPTRVDWRERQTLLKAAFPVSVNSPRATFDIQWGNVERPAHWN